MGFESFLRQTLGNVRSFTGKLSAGHDFLKQTLGAPLDQLAQVPGLGDVLKSYAPIAGTIGRAAKNLGQFSRGETLTDVPTVQDYERGISAAKTGTKRGQEYVMSKRSRQFA